MSKDPQASPRRLIEEPEFQDLLQAVAQDELSDARLAENGAALAEQLAQGAQLAAGTKATLTLIGGKSTVLISVLTTIATVGAISVLRSSPRSDVLTAPPLEKRTPRFTQHRLQEPPAPKRRPSRTVRQPTVSSASALKEQLALLQKAQDFALAQEHASAIRVLKLLERRYPRTSLLPELLVRRAKSYEHEGQRRAALRDVRRALRSSALSAKKPQLFYFKGDLLRALGECKKAKDAYLNAIGLGLSGADADAARAGIQACKEG